MDQHSPDWGSGCPQHPSAGCISDASDAPKHFSVYRLQAVAGRGVHLSQVMQKKILLKPLIRLPKYKKDSIRKMARKTVNKMKGRA